MNDGLSISDKTLLNLFTSVLLKSEIVYSYLPENISNMKTDNIIFNTLDNKHKITFTIVNGKEAFFAVEENGETKKTTKQTTDK